MGLKKDTPEVKDAEAAAMGSAPQKPAASKPQPAAAPKPAKKAPQNDQVQLVAVYNSIGDPITGIKYQVVGPMPGVVKEGNWLDAQIKAGILKVCD